MKLTKPNLNLKVERNFGVRNTSLAIRITIVNDSKTIDLRNVTYPPTGSEDCWGRWSMPDDASIGTQPPVNILKGANGWAQLCGRSGSSSGAEAYIAYDVGELGIIQFNFSCPASGCNTFTVSNSSPLIYNFYTAIDDSVAADGPDTTVSDYPNDGTVPCSGHPLCVLVVISDAS